MSSKKSFLETTKSDDDSTSPRNHHRVTSESAPQLTRSSTSKSSISIASPNSSIRSSRLAVTSATAADSDNDETRSSTSSHSRPVAMATTNSNAVSDATLTIGVPPPTDVVESVASSRRRHRRTPPSVDEKALLRHRSADVAGTRSNQRPPRVRKRASSHRLSESRDPTAAAAAVNDNKTVVATTTAAVVANESPLVSRHSRKALNAASSGSSDSSLSMKVSSPTPMPPPALLRGQQGSSDENVLVEETSPAAPPVEQQPHAPAVAAALPAKTAARRTSAVLSERLNHDDEYRSATTSETTRDGGEAAVLAASSASLEEDGSLLVSPNGSYILSRSKSRDSGSPLPNSGDSIAVDDDTRLWFGDLSRMERIVSFQRSSSGRHGISQTSSGLMIRHPLVLTGPSPSKDDDSSAGTLNTDSNQPSSLSASASNAVPTSANKQDSARKVLSFGSSPSSSDVEPRRPTNRTKRRHHRTRRPAPEAPIIQSTKSLHDVLSAVGATGDVPESLIVRVYDADADWRARRPRDRRCALERRRVERVDNVTRLVGHVVEHAARAARASCAHDIDAARRPVAKETTVATVAACVACAAHTIAASASDEQQQQQDVADRRRRRRSRRSHHRRLRRGYDTCDGERPSRTHRQHEDVQVGPTHDHADRDGQGDHAASVLFAGRRGDDRVGANLRSGRGDDDCVSCRTHERTPSAWPQQSGIGDKHGTGSERESAKHRTETRRMSTFDNDH
jgi:hypothetical protein